MAADEVGSTVLAEDNAVLAANEVGSTVLAEDNTVLAGDEDFDAVLALGMSRIHFKHFLGNRISKHEFQNFISQYLLYICIKNCFIICFSNFLKHCIIFFGISTTLGKNRISTSFKQL